MRATAKASPDGKVEREDVDSTEGKGPVMADEPQAGWYPDPSGDPTRLRWWDGTQWTDQFAPAVQAQSESGADGGQAGAGSGTASGRPEYGAYAQPEYGQYAQPGYAQQPYAQQPYGAYAPGGPYAQPYQYPPYVQGGGPAAMPPMVMQPGALYAMTETDRSLRLAAFVLNVIATVALGWLIVPLAWMLPMTVHSWSVYKGVKANTVAFGVCTLLFLNTISGVLLLISQKEA